MEGRYNAAESDRQTDEFMKPIILEPEGTIKGEPIAVAIGIIHRIL
jgi:hypothetical protein